MPREEMKKIKIRLKHKKAFEFYHEICCGKIAQAAVIEILSKEVPCPNQDV
jgi:hypothetical protein